VVGACVIVPAFEASATIGGVVDDLRRKMDVPLIVVDDGSTDATGEVAASSGALVVRHERNLGKGAALRTGLREAARQGLRVAVTVDADGQHPTHSAEVVLGAREDPRTLVLGVRDLVRDGAPSSNQFGNRVSNVFLSCFAGRELRDTQCGLRRYPVRETLALGSRADGYAFEAEVILRAIAGGLSVAQVPVEVVYPSAGAGHSHFRRMVDPTRIVVRIASTVVELGLRRSWLALAARGR
jgi:glycosyltransferase involved in cell wall biosynthesis